MTENVKPPTLKIPDAAEVSAIAPTSQSVVGSLVQTWRGGRLGLMKRGKDRGERKRRLASASEAASRSTMNDRAKSAKKQQQADDAAAARSRMQAALSRGSMQAVAWSCRELR